MMRVLSRAVVSVFALVAVLGISACGLTGGDYSCDLRPKNPQCTDWRGLIGPSVTQEALCKTLNTAGGAGVFASIQCPSVGSVGGCQTNSGAGLQTNWFYAPRTAADVQAECSKDKTTFVAP
jgi:hypothetical protein